MLFSKVTVTRLKSRYSYPK